MPATDGGAARGEEVSHSLLPLKGIDLKEYLANLEKNMIAQALDDSGGVVARAAGRLQMRRTTLVERIKKYALQKKRLEVDSAAEQKAGKEQEEPDQAVSG